MVEEHGAAGSRQRKAERNEWDSRWRAAPAQEMRSTSDDARERESACMVQVEFSSGRSRCSCCSRVCIVFTSSSHPPWATLFPCFSLLFHPFRRCAPRSFPPRLSFFIRRRPRFARVYRIDCIFAGKYCEIGVKPKISRRIGLEMVVGKDSYLGYRSFESQVDIYETR